MLQRHKLEETVTQLGEVQIRRQWLRSIHTSLVLRCNKTNRHVLVTLCTRHFHLRKRNL